MFRFKFISDVSTSWDGISIDDFAAYIWPPAATANLHVDHFQIYPNPGRGLFFLETGLYGVAGSIEVKNTIGQLLKEQELPDISHVTLHLEDFQPGIYFVSVVYADQKITGKIIIVDHGQ
jgi:hypothetical protein